MLARSADLGLPAVNQVLLLPRSQLAPVLHFGGWILQVLFVFRDMSSKAAGGTTDLCCAPSSVVRKEPGVAAACLRGRHDLVARTCHSPGAPRVRRANGSCSEAYCTAEQHGSERCGSIEADFARVVLRSGFRAQSEWIADIYRVAARIPVQIEPTRQPDRVLLRGTARTRT